MLVMPKSVIGFPSFGYRLLILFLLYTVQGLPYGFFITALSLFLREAGWSRTAIGFLSILGLPWFLKPLWAPLVDRFSWPTLGRRKSWILPCMGGLAIWTFLLALQEPGSGSFEKWFLLLILGINLFAATQDIAVDGLAVDILAPDERGPGNAAQVVGFKVGMLLSGGLLLAFAGQIGWQGFCLAMSLISFCVFLVTAWYPEVGMAERHLERQPSITEILDSLVKLVKKPGFPLALLLIGTYKMGESLVDAMYKLFLLDAGMSFSDIGLLCGSWGLGFSLAGSLLGGWSARGSNRLNVLLSVGLIRFFPLAAIAALPFLKAPVSFWILYPVTLSEHFAGGMLTTVMFAFMMDLCDRRVGATHYTVLAAVEVAGKMSIGLFAGLLADRFGYGILFMMGATISGFWLWLTAVSRRKIIL